MDAVRNKKGKPNAVDIAVGRQLRIRRLLVGLSQEKLASEMDLTFQQIQKYEKGVNRISAGRLHQLGQVLKVPVAYFYADYNSAHGLDEDTKLDPNSNPLENAEVVKLIKYFQDIEDNEIRQLVLDYTEKMSRISKKF